MSDEGGVGGMSARGAGVAEQNALRASEARFRILAEESPVILWARDVHGDPEFVNRAFREFYGVTTEQVEGTNWRPPIHPDDAPLFEERELSAVRKHTPFTAEARVRRADGGLKESPDDLAGLDSSVMMEKLKDTHVYADEGLARIEEIIRLGQPVKGEEVALQGGRTYLRDFVPLHVDGESGGRLWVHFDITERKLAEEALREEDRRKAEFLAVLSHELRNPLAPIRNSIYLLERSETGSKQAAHAREVIRCSSTRASSSTWTTCSGRHGSTPTRRASRRCWETSSRMP